MYIGQRLNELLAFYHLPRQGASGVQMASWRLKRWHTWCNQQRALAGMANRLVSPGGHKCSREDAVVGWGDKSAGSGGCIRRHFGGAPNKQLRRAVAQRAQLWEVDEDMTSKLCSHCAWQEPAPSKAACLLADGSPECPGAWRWKQHTGCVHGHGVEQRLVWDRDVNAARNILQLLLLAAEGHTQRPLLFCRGGCEGAALRVRRVPC
jgi:hypothetical protein